MPQSTAIERMRAEDVEAVVSIDRESTGSSAWDQGMLSGELSRAWAHLWVVRLEAQAPPVAVLHGPLDESDARTWARANVHGPHSHSRETLRSCRFAWTKIRGKRREQPARGWRAGYHSFRTPTFRLRSSRRPSRSRERWVR